MTTPRGYAQQKDNYAKRLRRIEGQGGDDANDKIAEASAAIARLVRS